MGRPAFLLPTSTLRGWPRREQAAPATPPLQPREWPRRCPPAAGLAAFAGGRWAPAVRQFRPAVRRMISCHAHPVGTKAVLVALPCGRWTLSLNKETRAGSGAWWAPVRIPLPVRRCRAGGPSRARGPPRSAPGLLMPRRCPQRLLTVSGLEWVRPPGGPSPSAQPPRAHACAGSTRQGASRLCRGRVPIVPLAQPVFPRGSSVSP